MILCICEANGYGEIRHNLSHMCMTTFAPSAQGYTHCLPGSVAHHCTEESVEHFTLEDRKRNFTNSAIFSCVGKVSCLALEEISSILGLFFMVAWHFELREAAGKENVKVQFCPRLSFES